jgi:hypothetical protein
MSSRLLRWVVIAFTCFWFGALVPAHTRGQIKLAGSRSAAANTPETSHCSKGGHCNKKSVPSTKQEAPKPEQDTSDCAVCHLILGLHTPPPVTTYEVYLGLVRGAPIDHTEIAPLRHTALPFHGLDPPTV